MPFKVQPWRLPLSDHECGGGSCVFYLLLNNTPTFIGETYGLSSALCLIQMWWQGSGK